MGDWIDAFFGMGGHAAFIWLAYAITTIVMLVLVVVSIRRLERTRRDLELMRGHVPEDRS